MLWLPAGRQVDEPPRHRRQPIVTEEAAPAGRGTAANIDWPSHRGTLLCARRGPVTSTRPPRVDGDPHSIELARGRVADRVDLVCSPLEQFRLDRPAALVVNNISMHECRDIDLVTGNVLAALEPGGWFVISDFPSPTPRRACAASPAGSWAPSSSSRPRSTTSSCPAPGYDDLLARHGFTDLGSASLTPMRALT
jgi:SAM-dependent methyltransferase